MKKILLGLATIATMASADFLGVSVGAGMWQENIDGYVKNGDKKNYLNNSSISITDQNNGNLKLSDEIKPYIWAKFIHPIPLIPNVRAEYRQYHTTGTNGHVVGKINMFGEDIDLTGVANTDITMNSYDVTAFYELKFFVEVEAGLGINVLDGTTDITVNGVKNSASFTAPIPYLYGRVESPTFMGFSFEAQAKYLDVSEAFYHDYQGAVKYHLPTPIIDISITAGYKTQEIYAEDGDDVTDMKFSGAYAELGARW